MTSATPKPRAGEHTEGPWFVSSDGCTVVVGRGLGEASVADCYDWMESTKEANARRIVACVNALEGMPTELLETHGVNAAVANEHRTRLLMGENDALRAYEAKLVEALRETQKIAIHYLAVADKVGTEDENEALMNASALLAERT